MKYSKEVMDNFLNPKNMGEMKDADAIGEVGNPACGDIMKIYLKVNKDSGKIDDIKFQTFGCAAAIATSSAITEIAKGKSLTDAEKITMKEIAEKLNGLPPLKMHCSNMATEALKKAIKNYNNKVNS